MRYALAQRVPITRPAGTPPSDEIGVIVTVLRFWASFLNVVAVILVVLAVAGFGLYIVWRFIVGVADAAVDAKNGFVERLGRKHWNRTATIPDELLPGSRPLPKTDPDRAELNKYEPRSAVMPTLKVEVFMDQTSGVFAAFSNPHSQIDIERIPEILSVSSFVPYEPVFSLLSEEPHYSVPAPTKPSAIAPVPSWTPWRPVFAEPSFSPPYWEGRFAFLNRFVYASHRKEFERVEDARSWCGELMAECAKRNQELDDLSQKAQKKHDKALALQEDAFASAVADHRKHVAAFVEAFRREQDKLRGWRSNLQQKGEAGLLARLDMALRTMKWPAFASRESQSKFDIDSGVLVHEHRFPDISSVEWIKHVELKSGWVAKPANQKEKKDAAAKLYPSLCLRLAAELARLDDEGMVKAVAVNGWADYTEKATGQQKRAYCASLFATKEQVMALNLVALDPLAAFSALKGIAAHSLEITPIAPILRLDTNDPRFVDAKEILDKMAQGENLASMDWEDFEHLCRELFERAFADSGAEVKVTQASRDQGVDAVIFDPDPLRGGKIVVQAKRYTNTVDVSAVRDLFGSVMNEGAIKGILVTTSHYGPEAYSFAKDKPLTLINGRELLGLLEKHGYKFRINLAEAKSML